MKRITAMMLALAFIFTGAANVFAEDEKVTVSIKPSEFEIMLGDEFLEVGMYDLVETKGNNRSISTYFRLRDIAAVLSDTDARFNVGFDNKTKQVTLEVGKAYEKRDTDLVRREAQKDFKRVELKFVIGGKLTEKGIDALIIGNEYYVELEALRRITGYFFRTVYEDKIVTITVERKDIKTASVDEIKSLLKGSEYSVFFVWAPWCPHCVSERDHLAELLEYTKTNDVKIVSAIGSYADYDYDAATSKFDIKGKYEKLHEYGLTKELTEYVKELTGTDQVWLPTVFIMDKDGKALIEYDNEGKYSWVGLIEMIKAGKIDEVKAEYKAIAEAAEAAEAAENGK